MSFISGRAVFFSQSEEGFNKLRFSMSVFKEMINNFNLARSFSQLVINGSEIGRIKNEMAEFICTESLNK
jgi:lipopolysaccharide/colanic/teichoic acid biosynthesis glycosyltransferase